MNKNFKKVLDLIAEMKQSFATASMKFEQATLMDGDLISLLIILRVLLLFLLGS